MYICLMCLCKWG